jgi:hypothetical protein
MGRGTNNESRGVSMSELTPQQREELKGLEKDKLYASRDIEPMIDTYIRHVDAMTGEGLHSKGAIAAELAFRDVTIAALRQQLAAAEERAGKAEEIVTRLPVLADGAPFVPMTTIYRRICDMVRPVLAVGVAHNATRDTGAAWITCDSCTIPARECYSTEAAARAAGKAE